MGAGRTARRPAGGALALAAVASGLLVAVARVPAQGGTRAAWDAFRARHGPGWQAEWSARNGTPRAIWGPGLRAAAGPVRALDDAQRIARALLDRHAELLGVGRSRLAPAIAQRVGEVFVLVYAQRHAGLEVVGGRADVRLRRDGVVTMFGADAVAIPAGLVREPAVPAALARSAARAALGAAGDGSEAAPEPVVWAGRSGPPRLAWRVRIDAPPARGGLPRVGDAYVDAANGELLEFADRVCACGGCGSAAPVAGRAVTGRVTAWLQRVDPTAPLVEEALRGVRVTAAGGGTAFTDGDGRFAIPFGGAGPVTVQVDVGPGSGERVDGVSAARGSPVTASVQATPGVPVAIRLLAPGAGADDWSQPTAFWHADDAHRWITALVGAIPTGIVDLRRLAITVNESGACNAYYLAGGLHFFAAGGGCHNTASPSVIYHEWGHALDDAFGGLAQADGMSEGWGDILSCYRLDDPRISNNVLISGGAVRTALNTRTYPAGGSQHQQGETWMGWAWDVRSNLIAALGRPAGIARAEAIVVASIAADARDQPAAVREVFVLDDDDGNLNNGTPHYDQLVAACLRRRLPYPRADVGTIAHAPLTSTERQLEPRVVRATVRPKLGSFPRVEVVYAIDGAPAARRDMVPTANAGEYVALLPALPSPATVDYRIEATHSSGIVVQQPALATLRYRVGRERAILAEDFESGAQGWTHGARHGVDEWELGVPAGRSGLVGAVEWRDPPGAVSGSRVAGIDLGAASDGVYPPNADSSLHAPPLDLRGRSGVRLAFKRWLSVEPGEFDAAELLVAGVPVWANPRTTDVLDRAWVDVELPLTPSGSLAAVAIEWRLRSDGQVEYGGWQIDDVAVFEFAALPPPALRASFDPAQVPIGGTTTFAVQGAPAAPAALLLSTGQGPWRIPGLPVLYVDPGAAVLPLALDASGRLTVPVGVTADPLARGELVYGQVVQLVGGVVRASNPLVLLHGR